MRLTIFFPVLLIVTHSKFHRPFQKRTITVIPGLALVEIYDASDDLPNFKTLEQVRLEDDENLLEEQQLIENMETPFDNPIPTYQQPPVARTLIHNWVNNAAEFITSQQEMITLACSGIFIFGCGMGLIYIIVQSSSEIQPRKKRRYHQIPQNEQEPFLTQSLMDPVTGKKQYSILDSRTESSIFSQRVDEVSKYRITEYTPEIRDPFQESFVKQSVKGNNTINDLSLLEIDELLKEMIPDSKIKEIEQYF